MKATGIVRRIDDLGRVVIPKEIRRTLRIREGDPLEIYTEKDGEVIFKKYSPMGELSSYAAEICESLYKSTGGTVAVCDRDSMIAVSGGGKKELLEKPVSKALEEIMEKLLFSPHIGGITGSSFRRGYAMIWEDIEKLSRGEKPGHIVNQKELEQR